MLVFKAELMYVPKPVGGAGGGGAVCTTRTTPFPKEKLSPCTRIGCLNLAFSGAQKRAEMLHHPCILGGAQQRGQNQSTKKTKKPKFFFSTLSLNLPRVLQIAPTGDRTHGLAIAETQIYPLGYGPSLRNFCSRVVLIFGPIWFSSIIGFS